MTAIRGSLVTLFFMLVAIPVQSIEKYATGLTFLDQKTYAALPQMTKIPIKPPMPFTVDLSKFIPLPQSQGMQGSCVGWAVAYAKSYHENIERIEENDNQRLMHSPSYIYNQIVKGNCGSGSHINEALDLIKNKGVPLLEEFPYNDADCSLKPNTEVDIAAGKRRSINWGTVDLTNTEKIQNVLAYALPIIVGLEVYENFFEYDGGIYSAPDGSRHGGHAMLLIGYDSDKNAYRLINSWGQSWGDNGYMWITPNALANITKEAYVVFDDAESYIPWRAFQRCLSEGKPRCCEHVAPAFAKVSELCGSQPGIDPVNVYMWCVKQGKPRCCEHLTKDQVCTPEVQMYPKNPCPCMYTNPHDETYQITFDPLEDYKSCMRVGAARCCEHLSRELACSASVQNYPNNPCGCSK